MTGRPTRDRILDAAREELAAHGYNGTSTRNVAKRAQVDIRLLHHYFGSRSRLLHTALQPGRRPVRAQGEPEPDDGAPGPDRLAPDTGSDAAWLTSRLTALWGTDPLARRALVASAMTDGPTGYRLASFVTTLLRDLEPDAGTGGGGEYDWECSGECGDRSDDAALGPDRPGYDELSRAVAAAQLLGLAVLCESGAMERLAMASSARGCRLQGFSLESQLAAVLSAVSAEGGLDAVRG
ncbi:TetR/AcrR family transcriptional regulator [Streptomyces sp. NPDC057654]|uniref:TetR/AcrR family transcriptional regulator n=1 Tax=Streptomyces sp. NPDC057654 TaxID=3346196 RepID=UPI0036C0E9D8